MKGTRLSLLGLQIFLFPFSGFRMWALSSERKVDQVEILDRMFLSSKLMEKISPNRKTLIANT